MNGGARGRNVRDVCRGWAWLPGWQLVAGRSDLGAREFIWEGVTLGPNSDRGFEFEVSRCVWGFLAVRMLLS